MHSSELLELSVNAAKLSRWVDNYNAERGRNSEALSWHRVTKVCEEAGEVWSTWLSFVGGNPRKDQTSASLDDVIAELLDTALAALGAVEHLSGNRSTAGYALLNHSQKIVERAGV